MAHLIAIPNADVDAIAIRTDHWHVFARATSSQRTLRGEWHPSFESASQAVTTLGLVALRNAVGVRNSEDNGSEHLTDMGVVPPSRKASRRAGGSSHPIGHRLRIEGDLRRRRPLHRTEEEITMLRKLRIALVVTIMAVPVASSADSASALGFYGGGDFGLFGFGGP